MSKQYALEEYDLALKKGQKEYRERIMAGKNGYPEVLDEILPENAADAVTEVGLLEIPANRIVGVKSAGRITAFTANFLPLLDSHSEFARKWVALCEAHLGAAGIRDPIECYEYMGKFYVQDAAAKLSVLCAMLPADRDWKVLDCCAAPGGKSFAAAIAMQGRGQITSCDVYAHKAELIANGADRLGIVNLTAREMDATTHVREWENAMDAVIADVPCSGLGIIRKKPDIRYKNLKEIAGLPALQLQILKNQATYLRPGGVLLYSTCTLVREENEGVVEAFLQENRDFSLEPLPLPACFPKNETGMLALVPGEYDTDGFFIARLRRKA
jgi:16S rRNA (cytosine967-C5)-methyltransferase